MTSSVVRAAVAAVALCAVLLLAAPARAAEPLAVTSATPADGAVVPVTPSGGIPWQVTLSGPPPGAEVSVTVSSSPATTPDGTLSDQGRADFFFLSESAPGAYAGRSDPGPRAWSETPGTYYWQVRATWTDASAVFHSAAGEIERLFVGISPPPGGQAPGGPGQTPAPGGSPSSPRTTLAMSALDARFYVRAAIRQRTRRQPRNLRYACARVSSRSYRCRPRWRDSRNIYSSTTVTFAHVRTGGRIVARGTFTGRRASRRCARSRSVASCGRRFRWRVVTAARPVRTAR